MLSRKRANKRIFDRKKYGAQIMFTHKSKTFTGKIKDISLSGAFIIIANTHRFSKNDEVTIDIPFTNQNSHVSRKGKIIRLTNEGFAVKFS